MRSQRGRAAVADLGAPSGAGRRAGDCRRRSAILALVVAPLLCCGGCASYSTKLADLRPQLSSGAYDDALATVQRGAGGKDLVLAQLERGMILHQAGRWVESNEAFAAAERTADELYARSISEGALSLITNDLAISYRPRPFELAMVPYYRAMNYAALGQRESALVEARKTSQLLARYVDATIAGIERGSTNDLERTRSDPFMFYLSGMLYEWDGEVNDAFIAYRNAAVAYQDLQGLLGLEVPPWLGRDLGRTARRLGFAEEMEHLREVCPAVFAASDPLPDDCCDALRPGEGEVVLLVELGFVPVRRNVRLDLPILESDDDGDRVAWAWAVSSRGHGAHVHGAHVHGGSAKIKYWLSVAVPGLEDTPAAVRGVAARPPGQAAQRAARAHHPAATARITFEAEQPMVLFKTVLRGLAKYLATSQADRQGRGLGILANILGAATETADTRGWLTLPEQVQLVRLRLPAGVHTLELDLLDERGARLGTATLGDIAVRPGDWSFHSRRVFDR